jgi:hypothetical protein
MPIDRAEVVFTARDETRAALESVKRGFGDIAGVAGRVGSTLGALGGVGAIAGIAALGRQGIQTAANLADLAEKTSLSVETLSSLRRVAIIGGQSIDQVGDTAANFARNVSKAAGGNKELLRTFEALGISQQRLQGARFDELFVEFAQKVSQAENRTNALAFATTLAGESARNAMPFFRELATQGLAGGNVTRQQALEAQELERAFRQFKLTVDDLKVSLGLGLLPALTEVLAEMRDIARLSGSFGEAFAAFADPNPLNALKSTAERLKEIRTELDRTQQSLQEFVEGGLDTARLEARISTLVRQNEFFRAKQLRESLAGRTGEQFLDVRDLRARQRGFELPALPGKGASTAAADAARRAELALIEARGKAAADSEKRLADVRLDLLQRFYNQGLIGEREYWDRRREVQEAAAAASIAAVTEEVTARERALADARRRAGAGSAEALGAEKDLLEAQTRRSRLEEDIANASVRSYLESQRAAEAYADTVRSLEAQLAELAGRSAEAAAITFDQQNRGLRQRLETNRDEEGLERLTALRAARIAQAQFNDQRERATEITQRLALQEERVQNSLRVGAISELEALRRTSEARQASLDELGQIADALEETARSSGLPRLKLQAEELKVQLEALRGESDLVAQKFDTIFESSFTDALGDIASGAKSAKDAFRDMADSIVRDITRLAAQDVARQLFGSVGGGGGIGGILAGLFGRGGGGTPSSLLAGGIIGFATGTPYVPRDMLAMVHRGEAIVPAGQNRGGMRVIQNFNISGATDARSQEQIAAAAARGLARVSRRTL